MTELTFTRSDLHHTAEQLLELDPDPIPRLRLLRDVLHIDSSDPRLHQAKEVLRGSKWVRLLEANQLPDGTWGRFHSQDSTLKQTFPTTENAISMALASGLEKDSPILQKAAEKVLEYVEGRCTWPDPAEKHDNSLAWAVWVKHFSAAVLAQVEPLHPYLDDFWQTWAQVVTESFLSGAYDRRSEIASLNRLLDCRMKDPVPFHRKYPLLILSATDRRLPENLERQMLGYLLQAPQGIYYVCAGRLNSLPPITSRSFWSWTQGHKLLSRFASWRGMAVEAVNWIWAQRGSDGLWDLGSGIARRPFTPFPLSESWQRPENRIIDSSVEMLDLLSRCFDGA